MKGNPVLTITAAAVIGLSCMLTHDQDVPVPPHVDGTVIEDFTLIPVKDVLVVAMMKDEEQGEWIKTSDYAYTTEHGKYEITLEIEGEVRIKIEVFPSHGYQRNDSKIRTVGPKRRTHFEPIKVAKHLPTAQQILVWIDEIQDDFQEHQDSLSDEDLIGLYRDCLGLRLSLNDRRLIRSHGLDALTHISGSVSIDAQLAQVGQDYRTAMLSRVPLRMFAYIGDHEPVYERYQLLRDARTKTSKVPEALSNIFYGQEWKNLNGELVTLHEEGKRNQALDLLLAYSLQPNHEIAMTRMHVLDWAWRTASKPSKNGQSMIEQLREIEAAELILRRLDSTDHTYASVVSTRIVPLLATLEGPPPGEQ